MLLEAFVFSSLTWCHFESVTATWIAEESIYRKGEKKKLVFEGKKRKRYSERLHGEYDKEGDTW